MNGTTRVDLHCHSTFSDGSLSPEELAERLDAADVAVASLTDHDTVEGLSRFRRALSRRGIAFISGTEITAQCDGREAHLLAYGIDPAHAELLATLQSLRQSRDFGVHGIASSLRQRHPQYPEAHRAASAAPHGRIDIAQAIALVHRAGGRAVLAHPLFLERDMGRLRALLARLKEGGLDGVEVFYAAFSPQERQGLREMAAELGLLTSGGFDQHEATPRDGGSFGVDMPTELWKAFRDAVLSGRIPRAAATIDVDARPASTARARLHLRQFIFHIILPTVLAIGLFIGAIFWFLLPALERALLDRQRVMIRELTNSAWSILAEAHREEVSGRLTRQEAQKLARERVEPLRYGREGKDYFWLQDMHPRMLMHPYRKDLNDQDVSEFHDSRGARIFVEFADLVRRKKEGYLEYVWQWKDDPGRLAPKESYVRGFEPWGWIIGTGIYIEDVKEEIGRIEQNLVRVSGVILVLVSLLLLYVMRESLRLERERTDAEEHLRESTARYRALVEAATEGTLLVLDERLRYANPIFLELLGYSETELELLDLSDLLPSGVENAAAWDAIARIGRGDDAPGEFDGLLRHRRKSDLACLLTLRRIEFAGRSGFILMARPRPTGAAQRTDRRAFVDRLLQLPGNVATDLSREIAQAGGVAEVVDCCRRTGGLVRSLLDCGAHPRHITRMVSLVCDAATERFVALAVNELGPAPAPFAILALGSQGRQEQTLHTDQDNAILYSDGAGEAAGAYFLELGRRLCDWLFQAGYPYCRGDVMASNAAWRQPLSAWRKRFAQWIEKAEPEELLRFSIFFDLRPVCGEAALVEPLRIDIEAAVRQTPEFLPHFARNSLLFKPPLGIFGRIVTGGSSGEHPGMLDLKEAMMPIVSFARLYALKHEVRVTGTLDRLAALAAAGAMSESSQSEIATAYESLMHLRLRNQVAALQAGRAPDNLVDPNALGHIERSILKESLAEIEAVQKRISYDFLGGT